MENCKKCEKTQHLHGTLCKEHKTEDNDINQANDMKDYNGYMIEVNTNY